MHDRHDKLFRYVFGRPEYAAELLCSLLPPAVVAQIQLLELTPEKTSFVDERLAESRTDLLYRTRLAGDDGDIYFLIEHQSCQRAIMPYRFSRYMIAIWNDHLRAEPDETTLPPILPVLVHQGGPRGPRAVWRAPLRMSELFALPVRLREALQPHLLEVELVIDDLGVMNESHLRARAMSALPTLALWALAHSRYCKKLHAKFYSVMDLMAEIRRSADGLEALGVVLRYIIDVAEDNNPDAVRKILPMILPHDEHEQPLRIVDIIEQRGRRAGQIELVHTLIEQRFGSVPPPVRHRLEHAKLDELKGVAIRVLSATTLDDVLAGLSPIEPGTASLNAGQWAQNSI